MSFNARSARFARFCLSRLMGWRMSETRFLREVSKLPRRGWKVISEPRGIKASLRLHSPDSRDNHEYCPIEAVSRELTGPFYDGWHGAVPYAAGERIALPHKVAKKFMIAGDSKDDPARPKLNAALGI